VALLNHIMDFANNKIHTQKFRLNVTIKVIILVIWKLFHTLLQVGYLLLSGFIFWKTNKLCFCTFNMSHMKYEWL